MAEPHLSSPSHPGRRRPGAIAAALWLTLLAAAVAPAAAAADRVGKLLERADRSYQGHDYQRAAELFAKADKAAGGRSLPAVVGVARCSLVLFRYDDAIAATERWIKIAGDPEARAAGYYHLGLGLHWRGLSERFGAPSKPGGRLTAGVPEPGGGPPAGTRSLRAAVDAFRHAAEELGEGGAGRDRVLLGLADTLSWLGEPEQVRDALDAYAAAGGIDSYAEELRCWAGSAEKEEKEGKDGEGERDEEKPFKAEMEDVEPPVKIYAPPPQYPPGARAARMEGVVVLQAVVTKEGTVRCVRPLAGHPYPLAHAAVRTIKTWHFKPALLRGKPVDVYYNLTVTFSLGE